MECFDNSNIQGTSPVSACVVFRNARPSKKDYRIFNIKTVVGPDDFASMKEGVYRRYRRMLDEQQPLPQLIVIDGGKGQLNAAHSALKELGIEKKLTLISIAKNLEELFFYGDTLPIYLDKRSVTLRTIQHMRDEAHRWGLQNHRKKRSKNSMKSVLDEIKGIGKQTKDLLLMKFGSIEGIKNAGIENLEPLIGKSKTALIWTGISGYFDSQNREE
jgi:excinuclease ABC subunit C